MGDVGCYQGESNGVRSVLIYARGEEDIFVSFRRFGTGCGFGSGDGTSPVRRSLLQPKRC